CKSRKAKAMNTFFLLIILCSQIFFPSVGKAQEHVSCTQGLDKNKLATIHLIGEDDRATYWMDTVEKFKNEFDYFVEGTCKNAPKQEKIIESSSFPNINPASVHGFDDSKKFFLHSIIDEYHKLSNTMEIGTHIKALSKKKNSLHPQIVKKYIEQSNSFAIKQNLENYGIDTIIKLIQIYQNNPLKLEIIISNSHIEDFKSFVMYTFSLPETSQTLKSFFDEENYSFEMPFSEEFQNVLINYEHSKFDTVYQNIFDSSGSNQMAQLKDFLEKYFLYSIENIDFENKKEIKQRALSLFQTVTTDYNIYDQWTDEIDTKRYEIISQNIYSFFCSTLEILENTPEDASFKQKNLYVYLSADRITEIEQNLHELFDQNINIAKVEIEYMDK
ncbi:MAG: hypothetical protein KDD52_03705, partial [Bdellovibrionales bacterium]|nr:hypothetical protein [Bdellovibrionales bacterium]